MAVCSISVLGRSFWLVALLAILSVPALASKDADYSVDKLYTTSHGWAISVNVTRKSCAMSKLRDDDLSLMELGGDSRKGKPSYYLMFAHRSWKYKDGQTYDVGLEYDNAKKWIGGGVGVDLMRVQGVVIEDISAGFFNEFSGMTSLKLTVDGQSRGEFALEDAQKAFRKLMECMGSVANGSVSLEKIQEELGSKEAGKPLIAEDFKDWDSPADKPDAAHLGMDKEPELDAEQARPSGKDKAPGVQADVAPAPGKGQAAAPGKDEAPSGHADQGRAPDNDRIPPQDQGSSAPVFGGEYFLTKNFYDRRDGWVVSINKARRSCNIAKLFGLNGVVEMGGDGHAGKYTYYMMTTNANFLPERGVKYSVSITFNGRSTWTGDGLGITVGNLHGVTIEDIKEDSVVEFAGMSVMDIKIDGVRRGTYNLSGTRKALLRMFDCIKDIETGRISLAAIPDGDHSADDNKSPAPNKDDGGHDEVGLGGEQEKKEPDAEEGALFAYGTGFFVNGDGYLLTNAHVVDGCKDAIVRQGNAAVQPATIVAREKTNDLAILKVAEKSSAFGKFRGTPQIRLGDSIVVFGYPLAGLLSSTGNLATGLVSSLAGAADDVTRLQISAPVQSGNSGGAVVDQSGHVVGIVVAKSNLTPHGTGKDLDIEVVQNVNFAIKAGMAQFFLDANQIHYDVEAPGNDLKIPDVAEIARSFSAQVACEMKK